MKTHKKMRWGMRGGFLVALLFLFSVGLPSGSLLGVRSAFAEKPLVLVELFTSQGCSSCPAADNYFSDLAKEKDLAVLAWHVQYWDYIGWRDPFGMREAELRQRRYARRMRSNQVYTPQAVVAGKSHYVGSNRSAVRRGLRSVRKEVATEAPRLSLQRDGAGAGRDFRVVLNRGKEEGSAKFDVMVVLYQAVAETNVERGENRGRKLKDANIVRAVMPLGRWDGKGDKEMSFSLPGEVKGFDALRDGGFVVVAESRVAGEGTTGAVRWDFKRNFVPEESS